MDKSNCGEQRVRNGGAGVSRYLCIPCAVSEKDFSERFAASGGQWDGADAPRACINGREYNLVYSPSPVKVSCSRCGEEIHWAYHPYTTEPSGKAPSYPEQ